MCLRPQVFLTSEQLGVSGLRERGEAHQYPVLSCVPTPCSRQGSTERVALCPGGQGSLTTAAA